MASPECFATAFQQIHRVTGRTLGFMGANRADIDDVTQRLAVKIWRTWDEPHIITARRRPNASWEGYLARAARNEFFSIRRSERQRRVREWDFADIPHPAVVRPGTIKQIPDEPTDAEQALAWRRILLEITQLSTPRRSTIVRLSLVEHLTPNEIAERLGISSRTVRQHLAAGRRELHQRLSPSPEDL